MKTKNRKNMKCNRCEYWIEMKKDPSFCWLWPNVVDRAERLQVCHLSRPAGSKYEVNENNLKKF